MVRLLVRVLMGVMLFAQYQVNCEENDIADVVFRKLEDLDELIADVRRDMTRIEDKVVNKIDFAKASLRSELKERIKQQVREAMAEILQGESIEEMVKSQVVSEVKKLKHGHHQMKGQLRQVVKSLRDVQKDRETCKESLLKAERNASEFLTCSKYVVDSKILQRDLEQCNKKISERDMENQELIRSMISLNETRKLQLQKVNTSSNLKVTMSVESLSSTVTTTSSTTTPKPKEERSRIIAAPYRSDTQQQLHQLNIHSNTIISYPYLNLNHVRSLAYVSRLKKLLIALGNHHKIISSNLDIYGVKTMRKRVGSCGMAVDEDRELVFMTTHSPRKSISRMTTHGKHFTTISNLAGYGLPCAIAIDSKEENIYACDTSKVFMMSYGGIYVQTLATGSRIRALTLDNTAGILYYNDEKRLMKISLSNNVSSDVTTLSVMPWNLIGYNNTVYFSEYGYYGTQTIGAVHVRYEIVTYTLTRISGSGGLGLVMCLVP